MNDTLNLIQNALNSGGPALWAIAALSVITLAVIAWKVWRLMLSGVWSSGKAEAGVANVLADRESGLSLTSRNIHSRFVAGTVAALSLPVSVGQEEVSRLAARELGALRTGLRPLELIVTIAPLIGLLGTVLGMIEAFQALETSGGQADPAVLAGGIWEALLTTAAGMAVAIPAAVALSWFEGIAETVQAQMEDAATRLFIGANR
ncbi:MAG: MotA/TolQ/ExbB proton channel family protein [Yoonia sp.]|jgi:biopolymer transport protein ExbB|nr:MotA/TolQ/ExbB proton channel family protein [Yoonia sp.]